MNSAGERYLPRFSAETVLVEDFAEDDAAPGEGELPRLLGLTRRTGISRAELEMVVLRRRPEILEHLLGLEPRDFRLRLRGLVGGDVCYGGRHHICSIGVDDEREEVVARFAVMRRERFCPDQSGGSSRIGRVTTEESWT